MFRVECFDMFPSNFVGGIMALFSNGCCPEIVVRGINRLTRGSEYDPRKGG